MSIMGDPEALSLMECLQPSPLPYGAEPFGPMGLLYKSGRGEVPRGYKSYRDVVGHLVAYPDPRSYHLVDFKGCQARNNQPPQLEILDSIRYTGRVSYVFNGKGTGKRYTGSMPVSGVGGVVIGLVIGEQGQVEEVVLRLDNFHGSIANLNDSEMGVYTVHNPRVRGDQIAKCVEFMFRRTHTKKPKSCPCCGHVPKMDWPTRVDRIATFTGAVK